MSLTSISTKFQLQRLRKNKFQISILEILKCQFHFKEIEEKKIMQVFVEPNQHLLFLFATKMSNVIIHIAVSMLKKKYTGA